MGRTKQFIWAAIFIGILLLAIFGGISLSSQNAATERDEPGTLPVEEELAAPLTNQQQLIALARTLAAQSKEMSGQTARSPFAEVELDESWEREFGSFVTLAQNEAADLDASNGPVDLACIFRGMAGDAQRHLENLKNAETTGQQATIWLDAHFLFADVEAVLHPAVPGTNQSVSWNGRTCPAASPAMK